MGDRQSKAYSSCNFSTLSPGAIRVLFRMAAAVMDTESGPGKDDAFIYYGGWKSLTVVLGYGVVLDDDPLPPSAERKIARAIKELREAGLLEVASRGSQQGHWNRVYYLPPIPVRYFT